MTRCAWRHDSPLGDSHPTPTCLLTGQPFARTLHAVGDAGMTLSLRSGARMALAAVALTLMTSGARAEGDHALWNAVSSGVFPMVGLGELALLTDGHQGRKAAWQGLEVLSINLVATEGLKYAVGERRPHTNEHDSFPSAHASTAFAMAEIINQYDGRYAPLAFGAA